MTTVAAPPRRNGPAGARLAFARLLGEIARRKSRQTAALYAHLVATAASADTWAPAKP